MKSPVTVGKARAPSGAVQRAGNLAAAARLRGHRRAHAPLSLLRSPSCSSPAAPPRRGSRRPQLPAPSPQLRSPARSGAVIGLTAQRARRPLRQPGAAGPRRHEPQAPVPRPQLRARRLSLSVARRRRSRVTHVDARAARRRRHRSGGLHLRARRSELSQRPSRRFGDHRVGIVEVRLGSTAASAGSPLLPAAIRQLRTIRFAPIRLIGEPANTRGTPHRRARAGRRAAARPARRAAGTPGSPRAASAKRFHGQTARQSSQP